MLCPSLVRWGSWSAYNETHSNSDYKGGGKEIQHQDDKVRQQSAELKAGGDVLVNAGENITLVSSKIGAGDEAYLVAGDKIELLAANDSDYSLYDMKEKGNWGQSKTQRDEVTDIKAVGSEISAGADITLRSGGDQKYQGAKLDSGNDIAIVSGGSVTFEAVKDLHQESHEKSKGNLAWQSSKGKGQTDETLRQTQLIAQGNVAIKAVEGLKIDIKHIDQQSVSQAIDAMVKADPNLAWLKEAEKRGDVDWRQVREIHDSWKYSNSGLGAAPSMVIAIVASAYLGPLYGAMASNLAIGTINNKGDLGRGLKEATSSDNLKRYAITAATAYLAENYFDDILKTKTNPFTQKVTVDLSSLSGAGRFAANQVMQSVTSTALSKAVGQGGSFSDALKDSLYNTFAAAGFNAIGDFGKTHGLEAGDAQMVVMHAVMGGLAAEARGGSFAAGAAGAGLNEGLVGDLDKLISSYSPANREALLTMSSQLVGILGVLVQNNNATADQLETGAWAARNSTQYNYLLHNEIQARAKEVKGCGGEAKCEEDALKRYADLDKARNENLPGLCQSDPGKCLAVMKQLAYESGANDAFVDSLRHEDVRAAVGVLLASQSNDEAIAAIQQELVRLQYGDRTAFTLQVLQMAAAGNLTKNAKVDAKGTGTGSSGAENIAAYPKLKDQLAQQNWANIAAQDSRLAAAVKGSGTANPNFSVGRGTVAEADLLGKIWVGDGAKKTADGTGWISADGTRVYRTPAVKSSPYATTGVQANFETYSINPVNGQKIKVSNGHLDVTD